MVLREMSPFVAFEPSDTKIEHSHRIGHSHIVIRIEEMHPAGYGWPWANNG